MWKDDLPRTFPKGSELTNRLVDAIVRELWRWRKVQAAPPLIVDYAESDQPPIFSFINQYVEFAWGNTGSGFTAASGTPPVPTSQTITLYDITPGSPPVFTNRSPTVTAWNPYSASGGIAASKTAFFGKTLDGTWWVITADC